MELRGQGRQHELGSGVLALPGPSNEGRKLQRGAGLVPREPLTLHPLRRPNPRCPLPPRSTESFPKVGQSRSGFPSDLKPGVCSGGGGVALARSQAS